MIISFPLRTQVSPTVHTHFLHSYKQTYSEQENHQGVRFPLYGLLLYFRFLLCSLFCFYFVEGGGFIGETEIMLHFCTPNRDKFAGFRALC